MIFNHSPSDNQKNHSTYYLLSQMKDKPSPPINRPNTPKPSNDRSAIAAVIIALVYWIAAELFQFIFYESNPTPIWPPAGLALVAVLWYQRWGLIGIAVGDLTFDILNGAKGIGVLTLAVVLQAWLGAWWLQRRPGKPFIDRPRDILGWFLLATFASTLVNSIASVGVQAIGSPASQNIWLNNWFTFWLGDSMGILVVVPLLLTSNQILPALRRQGYEMMAIFGSIAAFSWLLFAADPDAIIHRYISAYFAFPLTIWAALRLGLLGATLSSFSICAIAIWATKAGRGPFIATSGDFSSAVLSLQLFAIALTITALTLAAAEIQMRQLARQRANLGRYFPPVIVDRLAQRDTPLGPDRKQRVAVLFADIIGFATIIETMSPESVMDLLREFHSSMEAIVFQHGGMLGQYVGESSISIFGAPEVSQNDSSQAIACARAMIKKVADFNTKRAIAGKEPAIVGIGIDCGMAAIGEIGSQRQMAFTVAGKVLKIATRLKDLCPQFQADIIITKSVAEAVKQEGAAATELLADFVPIGEHQLLGFSQPLKLLAYSETGSVIS
jgi:class 3 adenylate cyclase